MPTQAEPHRQRHDRGVVRRRRRALRPDPAALPDGADRRDRRRQPRAATCSTSAAAPASPRGSSSAAGCSVLGVDVDARMAEWRAAARPRRRGGARSRPGIPPAGRSTRSSPGRPGTGSTRSPAPPRRPRCCVPAAGWPCSGTCSSRRPSSATAFVDGLPPRAARAAAQPRAGPAPTRTDDRSERRPTASGGRARSANRSSGGSSGSALHPRRVARPGAHPRRPHRLPPDTLAAMLAGIGAAVDAAGGACAP